MVEFPELEWDYRASELFPLFRNRVMNRRRPDLEHYLRNLDLARGADPFEILATSGGYRATDAYEVFPKLVKSSDGSFKCRFFLHGWRHVSRGAQERLKILTPGEQLYVTLELTNPSTRLAVQIQTTDYHMIGWAPRYLVRGLGPGDDRAATQLRCTCRAGQPPSQLHRNNAFSSRCEGNGMAMNRWRAATTSRWLGTDSASEESTVHRIGTRPRRHYRSSFPLPPSARTSSHARPDESHRCARGSGGRNAPWDKFLRQRSLKHSERLESFLS